MEHYHEKRPLSVIVAEGCLMNLLAIIAIVGLIVRWIIGLFKGSGGP